MRQYYKFCTKTRKSNAKPIALRRRFAGSRQQAALPVTVTNRQPGLSLTSSSSLSLRQRSNNNNNNIHRKNKNNVWKNYFNFFFVVSCFFFLPILKTTQQSSGAIFRFDFDWQRLETQTPAGAEKQRLSFCCSSSAKCTWCFSISFSLSAHVSECVCKRVHNCQFVQCWKRRKGVVNIRKGVVNKEGWEIEQHSASLP